MSEESSGVINVEILGQRYPIRSGLDASYVTELAGYVHQKMQTASERSQAGDAVRVAVLAALNIADEYFRCRDSRATSEDDVRRRAIELEEIVDRAIASVE